MVAGPEQQPGGSSLEEEFSSKTEQLRAQGVEKIMNEGFPNKEGEPGADQYGKIWDKVDTYVMAVQSDTTLNEKVAGYLRDSGNADAFNGIVGRLKAGEAPANFIAAEESSLPNRQYLSALMAFEGVAKAAIRSEGGKRRGEKDQLRDADLLGPAGEAAHRFIQVAEILAVESNAVMIKNNLHPLGMQQMSSEYAQRFDRFAQRRDVPQIYRDRAREMAANVRIDAMKEEAAKPTEASAEPAEPTATEAEDEKRGIAVTLDYDLSRQLLRQENPMTAEDLRHMQSKIEALTRENTTQNAFEVAKLAANLQRAGVRIGEGQDQIRAYVQRQRSAMQTHGPRALAQYLAYGKYLGCVTQVTPQEEKWLMAAIHDRLKNDPAHKGLTRLAMNARYLQVHGYTPELVRQGVIKEIEDLKAAGDLDAAVAEAARARRAGVDPTATFTSKGDFTSRLNRRAVEYASAERWNAWARLRNNLDLAWRQLAPRDKDVTGLMSYFSRARSQAQEHDHWDRYAAYTADVREISDRDAKRLRRESVAPVTAEVRQRGVLERARLSEREYQEYLGGPAPAAVSGTEAAPAEAQAEAPSFREVPQEPVVTGGFFRRIWGLLFGRRERRPSPETPTDQAV